MTEGTMRMLWKIMQTHKISLIMGVIALLGSSQIAAATPNRPAINPDFDPDESCILDILQDKCDPGIEGECPEGFAQNEDNRCAHRVLVNGEWEWICPDGYHIAYDDESGQCFPNDEGCRDDGYILIEKEDENGNNDDHCLPLNVACDEQEVKNEDYCKEYIEENRRHQRDIFCDGKNRDYEGIPDLPELEEGECYGTCEMMSKGLACDIEKTDK